MRCTWIKVLCCVGALTACSDKLSKEEADMLDAVIFALDGVEDNAREKHRLVPWKREITGRTIEFETLGRNSYGFSDDETNAKTKNSSFVRYIEKK